jgi:hypothetical protein
MSTLLFTGSADVALWRVDTTTGTAKTVTGTTLVQEAGAGIYTLAGTYDGAYIRLYVNGKEEGSAAALTGVISSPTVPFWIGRYSTAISTGVISYCHFASRAWSQPEIAQLHADPYCFLRPLVRRSYGFVGGGAPPAEASGYMRLGKYWW